MSLPVRTQILPLAYAGTYCVCTYMLYGLSRVEHSPPSHTPILVTVKLIPTSGLIIHHNTAHTLINWVLCSHRLCKAHWVTSWAVGSPWGRVICKCPHTGWQPFWCMSVPNNPVVRHSRQKYAVANELALRKLLILLTAVEHWRLQEEPNPSPVRHYQPYHVPNTLVCMHFMLLPNVE